MRRKTAEQRSAEHGNALHDYCEADRAKRDGVRRSCVKSACVSAMPVIYSLEYGALAQLVVRYIRIVEARGSTPLCSTRWVLDEHLLLQRRFRRESIVLMPNKKHHSEEIWDGAFFVSTHSISDCSSAMMVTVLHRLFSMRLQVYDMTFMGTITFRICSIRSKKMQSQSVNGA